jgi:hydroxyethylthiazole kinase-like uncharacterized protein yjeF
VPSNARPLLTSADLRAVETAARDLPLMERAGAAAAEVAEAMLAGRPPGVLVLAGPGNNGGDGFVLARRLRERFHDVTVVFRSDAGRLPADARRALDAWVAAGGAIAETWDRSLRWGLVVDAMFGIGLTRPPGGLYAEWIAAANAGEAPILALDVPSGLDGDTGSAHAPTVVAARTATFIALKPGLLTADGPDHCGTVSVHDLGIETSALPSGGGFASDWESARAFLRPRRRNTHKGSFGSLAILGGADGMVGAPLLAGRAALLLGAGKVYVGLACSSPPQVDWVQPELMLRTPGWLLDAGATALVVGPGLGTDADLPWLDRSLSFGGPLVADADLLNRAAATPALARTLSARSAPTVLTPHPAEAARLLAVSGAAVQSDRVASARRLAERFAAHVVLKGCGSVCAFPDGRWFVNTTGNPGLASGGTGDTLAGMLGALLAQGVETGEALLAAVALHGAAADALVAEGVGPAGITASEIAPAARRLLCAALPSPTGR